MMYVCVCVCINVVCINNIFDAHGRYIFSLRLRERGKIMVLADDISVCDTKQQQCLDGPRSPRCNSIGSIHFFHGRKFENSKKNSIDNKMCTS